MAKNQIAITITLEEWATERLQKFIKQKIGLLPTAEQLGKFFATEGRLFVGICEYRDPYSLDTYERDSLIDGIVAYLYGNPERGWPTNQDTWKSGFDFNTFMTDLHVTAEGKGWKTNGKFVKPSRPTKRQVALKSYSGSKSKSKPTGRTRKSL